MTKRTTEEAPAEAGAVVYWAHSGSASLRNFPLVSAEGDSEAAARSALMDKLHTREANLVASIAGDTIQVRAIAAEMAVLATVGERGLITEQQVARAAAKIENKARALLTEIQATDPEFNALSVLLRTSLPARAEMEAQFIDSLRALAYPAHIEKSLARGAGRSPIGDRGAWATLALFDLWERATGQAPQHAERSQFARVAMVLLPQFGVEVDNWGDYLKRRLRARDQTVFNT